MYGFLAEGVGQVPAATPECHCAPSVVVSSAVFGLLGLVTGFFVASGLAYAAEKREEQIEAEFARRGLRREYVR